jgi:transcription elongation factor Elf1
MRAPSVIYFTDRRRRPPYLVWERRKPYKRPGEEKYTTMQCPYCNGEMRPDSTVSYWVIEGVRSADWVRCVRCDHACIQSVRPSKVGVPKSSNVEDVA